MSRDKGKRGEREGAAKFGETFGCEAYRGRQYHGRDDAPDVVCEVPIHLEVKRTERLAVYDALEQAKADAGDKPPMVLHRRNGKRWIVVAYLDDMPEIVTLLYLQLANK
jgi:Holliday junction resolvase